MKRATKPHMRGKGKRLQRATMEDERVIHEARPGKYEMSMFIVH